jgi:pimeloyl-ACP methyl ester carboxylesterase
MRPGAAPAPPWRDRDADDGYGATARPNWRETNWAQELKRIEVDGVPINYVDVGSGDEEPVVLVHGLGGQWQNWLENIPRFAQSRRVVAVDLPGFGCSEMPRERISIELYGRVVAELANRLDLAPAVVVGNSMGGFVSAEVATRSPETVERLMLLSSAGVSQMDAARGPIMVAAKVAGLLATSNLAQMQAAAQRPKLRHWILSVVARYPGRLKGDLAFEGMMKGANKPGFEDALRANLDYDFRERLPQIGCPTLVVWGEKDMIIPVRDADRFVELIPGARKIIMEDTGHVPMLERPRTFNDTLEEFLQYEVSDGELEENLQLEDDSASGANGGAPEAETAA